MEEFERLCDRARACAVGGRHAEAEQAFRSALQVRPGDARLSVELALVLRRLRRPAEAESHLRVALARAPGIASTHAELGAVLFEQGRSPEAAAAYREAIRLRPDFAKAHLPRSGPRARG
jgi:tetratricopeptide (TPR) repeat protein